MEGWIKIYRKLCQWEWYNISEMVHLFIHLLLNANRESGKWRGIDIERGQILTGLHSLNKQTGISIRTLRTCLNRLKKTKEIDIQTTNKYSIITICNFESYQIYNDTTDKQTDKQPTSNRQATDKQPTTNKKEEKEEKEETKKNKRIKRDFIPPFLPEVELYFEQNGYKQETAIKMFNSYSVANWTDSQGKPVLNWKQKAINVWFKDENKIKISKNEYSEEDFKN